MVSPQNSSSNGSSTMASTKQRSRTWTRQYRPTAIWLTMYGAMLLAVGARIHGLLKGSNEKKQHVSDHQQMIQSSSVFSRTYGEKEGPIPSVTSNIQKEAKKAMDYQIAVNATTPQKQNQDASIVWLASFPNSGTSYTMTLIETGSNLSTATHYGSEVSYQEQPPELVYSKHREGPYWDGLSGKLGTIRQLPSKYILTKTHCGGRCVKCGPDEYFVRTKEDFWNDCRRTSKRIYGHRTTSQIKDDILLSGVVHLIRNPYDNAVARFHLEHRHMTKQNHGSNMNIPDRNAEGFQAWCANLDSEYSKQESDFFQFDPTLMALMKATPCHGEFFRFAQWHSRLLQGLDDRPHLTVHTVHYEDYADRLNETAGSIFDFLEQTRVATSLRAFRNIPDYSDHFSNQDRTNIRDFLEYVATSDAWKLMQRYME